MRLYLSVCPAILGRLQHRACQASALHQNNLRSTKPSKQQQLQGRAAREVLPGAGWPWFAVISAALAGEGDGRDPFTQSLRA